MKSDWKIYRFCTAGFLLTIGLAACGKAENNSQSGENSDDTIISGKVDVKYTSRDLAGTWREENATKVKLSGDSYTIKEAGVYVFSGTLKDGQIIVEAGDTDKVQIVLNGVDIKCADGPAILIENADKTLITLAEGSENTVADGKLARLLKTSLGAQSSAKII